MTMGAGLPQITPAEHSPGATPAVATLWVSAGVVTLLGLSWRFSGGGMDAQSTCWLAVTLLSILGGCAALGWLRRASVGPTAPQLMLLLGALGMAGGLWWDTGAGGFAAVAALCLSEPLDLAATLSLHWEHLPMMHIGMIAAGLATGPLLRSLRRGCRRQFCARLAQNLVCSGWMVTGMAAGALVFTHLAAQVGGGPPMAMLGGMFSGMVWGMVASVSLYRTWVRISAGGN
ncbi:MAG: hypothetical protein JWP43_531 [Ramlibacter sp.]|nr:hypothetical protein [Ramlibacter sp.]